MIKIISPVLLILLLTSCVGINGFGKKKPETDQLILQENIQRFYARFTERVVEGFYKDTTLPVTERETVIRQYLLYDQEALKIATAPYPEINLLDMLVFVKVNKEVIKRYWIPEVYQDQGWGIYKAFVEAEKDIDRVSLKVITPAHLETINQGVRVWLNKNPDVVRVEKVRVGDFTKFARTKDNNDFSFSISQIFVDTKSAVKAVDQVTLVGNRALFLAQHMPYLLRLHARLGSHEILKDSISTLQSAPSVSEGADHLNSLVMNSNRLVNDIKKLLDRPKAPGARMSFSQMIEKVDGIVSKGHVLLGQAESLKQTNGSTLKELINHAGKILIIVAATASFFWWGGYYLCKRMLQKETV